MLHSINYLVREIFNLYMSLFCLHTISFNLIMISRDGESRKGTQNNEKTFDWSNDIALVNHVWNLSDYLDY